MILIHDIDCILLIYSCGLIHFLHFLLVAHVISIILFSVEYVFFLSICLLYSLLIEVLYNHDNHLFYIILNLGHDNSTCPSSLTCGWGCRTSRQIVKSIPIFACFYFTMWWARPVEIWKYLCPVNTVVIWCCMWTMFTGWYKGVYC